MMHQDVTITAFPFWLATFCPVMYEPSFIGILCIYTVGRTVGAGCILPLNYTAPYFQMLTAKYVGLQ